MIAGNAGDLIVTPRIGKSNNLLALPLREVDRKFSGDPSPRLVSPTQRGAAASPVCPGVRRSAVERGLDMQRRRGEGRAIRGAWEGWLRGIVMADTQCWDSWICRLPRVRRWQ